MLSGHPQQKPCPRCNYVPPVRRVDGQGKIYFTCSMCKHIWNEYEGWLGKLSQDVAETQKKRAIVPNVGTIDWKQIREHLRSTNKQINFDHGVDEW